MLLRTAIQLAYGVPGTLAYFFVFYAMFGVRQILSRNFIVIYVMMAITNIATWANAWLHLKFRKEPFFYFYYYWLEDLPVLVNIHSFLANHFYFAQNIDLLLLTFDRFATILSMVKDTKWWGKYYLFIALFIHFVVLGVHLALRLPMTDKRTANVQLGFGIAVFVVCSILNILTLKFLRKLRNNRHASTCFVAIFLAFRKIFGLGPQIMYEVMYYTSDLLSVGPALYTILLPGPIRRFLVGKVVEYLRPTSTNGGDTSPA